MIQTKVFRDFVKFLDALIFFRTVWKVPVTLESLLYSTRHLGRGCSDFQPGKFLHAKVCYLKDFAFSVSGGGGDPHLAASPSHKSLYRWPGLLYGQVQ